MRRIIVSVGLVILLLAGLAAWKAYQMVQAPNVREAPGGIALLLPDGVTFESLLDSMAVKNVLINPRSFRTVAGWMKFGDPVNGGRYLLSSGLSNRALINVLRSGNQTPVDLVINSVRTLPELSARIAEQIEVDSLTLLQSFNSSETLEYLGATPEELMTYFIPETYEVFWNMNSRRLIERMKSEHDKFWQSKDRLAKATDLGMSPAEVYTMASIVQKEAQLPSERDTVAGLYLNRIKTGMLLQADPTVVFATGLFDLRRVLNKHVAIESPYNTYKHAGLPPGPICMPDIATIDAVLNAAQHDYIYMCASPDAVGRHAFASNATEHYANARRYHRWLDKRGIR